MQQKKQQNRREMEFTVCTEEQLPEEVKELIEEKKEKPFQFTYLLQKDQYIAIGYGEQHGGGYSIKVSECSWDETNIYVDTTLLGSEESLLEVKSYPYIVLKCSKSEKKVIFL